MRRIILVMALCCAGLPALALSEEVEKKQEAAASHKEPASVGECESDNDCTYVNGACPGDFLPVSKHASDAQKEAVKQHRTGGQKSCLTSEYVSPPSVHCMDGACDIVPFIHSK
ncbi:MAG: hypothetical protein KGJ06_05770 [Pseudomonadota bacterium]|nr:hypothetical protein [Pseudomonadota bacterium]